MEAISVAQLDAVPCNAANDNERRSSKSDGAMEDASAGAHEENETGASENSGRWCRCAWFHGVKEAQGYAMLGVARGAIIMSNIFLSSALIRLASEEAGCVYYDNDDERETPECSNTVYGFKPSSLITNIAVVGGLLGAFFMPVIGAVLDYTSHRRLTGILAAASMLAIQLAQVFTLPSTWFPMAILQALASFIYMVHVLAAYSYIPDVAREVGQKEITGFTAMFNIIQFSSQAAFLVAVVGISTGFALNDVKTAHVSQALNVVWIAPPFIIGWKLLPRVQPLHALAPGQSLASAGFTRIVQTTKGIFAHYRGGLGLYLLANMFAEAGSNAFTSVSVTYLLEVLNMTSSEVGIMFLVVLLSTIPGSKLGAILSGRTTPKLSFISCLISFSLSTLAGSFVLDGPEKKTFAYLFGALWGVVLGWFYPTQNLIFSLIVPRGQESELTGFFIYARQVIIWLPPLIFTVMNESGIPMNYGLMSLIIFFVIAVILLLFMAPWDECIEAASGTNKMIVAGHSNSISDTDTVTDNI